MNKLLFSLAITVVSMVAVAQKRSPAYVDARRNGAEAQLKVRVVDNEGAIVSNANIRVFMGMNFRPKGYYLEGITDTSGVFVAEGKTCGDEISIDVMKDGYYSSSKKLSFAKMGEEYEVKNGKWLPYGATEVLRLRPIKNPISLVKHGFGMGKDVPCTNKWIGIDMAIGDFVKPYGKGSVADFEVMVEWDGHPPAKSDYCAVTIRFMEQLAGGYYAEKIIESEYPYVYLANEDATYNIRQFRVVGRDRVSRGKQVPLGDKTTFVTRTRCVLDQNGNLKTANYGFIRVLNVDAGWDGKPTMQLAFIFNPTPNDTNLECNMKNNLCSTQERIHNPRP